MPVGVTVPTQYPAELGGLELEADVGCSQSRAQRGTRRGVPPWGPSRSHCVHPEVAGGLRNGGSSAFSSLSPLWLWRRTMPLQPILVPL